MKRKLLNVFLLIVVSGMFPVFTVQTEAKDDLAELRSATAQFHRPEAAQAAGYDLVPGLDHCFNNPGVGGMGYHYINVDVLDTTVELSRPEAMIYTPSPSGLQLGAVEYIV